MKTNKRKEFNKFLEVLSERSLHALHKKIQGEFNRAKKKGYCSMEAVLYFDLAQVNNEIQRRAENDNPKS